LLEKPIHRYRAKTFLKEAAAKFHFESRNGTIEETGATLYSDNMSLLLAASTFSDHSQ